MIALALRGSSPAVRYWLWQIVAIKLLLMPLWSWTLPVPWPAAVKEQRPEATVPSDELSAAPLAVAPDLPPEQFTTAAPSTPRAATPSFIQSLRTITWQSWLLVAWTAIVLLQFVRLAWQRKRLSRLAARQSTTAHQRLRSVVDEIAQSLALNARPKCC